MVGHNNSFKPTPHRGVGHVLYATLARVRRPAAGRLNSGVRRQKSFVCSVVVASAIPGSVVVLVGMLVGVFSLR